MASPSVELQTAIYNALVADAAVGAIAGDRIFDGGLPEEFTACITFGPSDYTLQDMDCINGRTESLQIDCWLRGKYGSRISPARELADAVKDALHLVSLSLDVHALALLRVTAVRAFMDRDGVTGHGVVTVEAEIEER
ncbi:DUF3168 domain-containing protein [Rhodobacter sp. NTK016B]|uniref:DUF3168 domain-containing protein n=1 Tax=Rhodobacter sp. NTK016B TaxID=2759676 RepID=UPI001A8ECA31|nr:DUF3168 domain-containing protein [Rhodobacter sp. NTK016B]MBN8292816.1 DUF3168 domain-containing protein [Rhodobacter sp. NTK016B]